MSLPDDRLGVGLPDAQGPHRLVMGRSDGGTLGRRRGGGRRAFFDSFDLKRLPKKETAGPTDPDDEEDSAIGLSDVRAAGVDGESGGAEGRVRKEQAFVRDIVILEVEVHLPIPILG